ncbi:hypothetical protein K439DRAFT_1611981 [Ramaria rubella]|nr:hypothetical protein K439DRAFT_1611981 [Ramaria rubella]
MSASSSAFSPTTTPPDSTSTASTSPNQSYAIYIFAVVLPPQSSTLYLFTWVIRYPTYIAALRAFSARSFLATLLLLLAVSCAIVIRFRRRIEEALAAGVLIPGALEDGLGGTGRGRRRDFGEKPKLWEVWVDEHGQVHDDLNEDGSEKDDLGKGEGRWDEILPVSAVILSSNTPQPISLPVDGDADSYSNPPSRHVLSRLINRYPFSRLPSPHIQSPSPERNESSQESPSETSFSDVSKELPKEEKERLQISVLISMPNPNARRTSGSDMGGSGFDGSVKDSYSDTGKGKGLGFDETDADGETEIPDVVFGVAEVGFRA